ncbi:hypothetical protein MSG28_012646 [Choristoneura fumiferana]|uniref:Uncharacterized protein n=1 Tax=Choristoneura fumiferana TaxID=7141 RepID=A0ACC0JHH2_CHOFU|nr:hypothetical protein MSG28_012646 [Choristoneura fumiferana]
MNQRKDNGNKPRTEGDRDVTVSNEKFLFREPVVLISIVCLSLFSALSFYQQSKSIMRMPMYIQFRIYSLSTSAVPVIGLMFAAFLSEVTGRKHVYRYLFALSIFLAILVVSSNHPTVTCVLVLGLICLGSTWAWPESPYWLANKGKLEQSRTAFMWLRGKGGREELASVLKARRRPGPPKLFWISLLIAIATILPVVLTSIVCLTLLNALSFYQQSKSVMRMPTQFLDIYNLAASAVPVVGLMFAAFLSEVTGRKHIYRYLFALSIFSFILVVSSEHPTVIVLGLICLGSTWAWPESPYWLANKGKLEQSRTAFMWLRGKGGREELDSVLKARRRPGPPQLFWISLLIAIATILK